MNLQINLSYSFPIPNLTKFHQEVSEIKHADKALTDAGYVVSSKYPVIRTDALDIATKLIKCHTAVVTVAGLVQCRDDEHQAWAMVFASLNITQNLCSDI
jgi:hypothetical protein